MNKAEIEKGCGELIDSEYSHRECGILFLGTIELCPTCQARLSQRIDDEKEFKERENE